MTEAVHELADAPSDAALITAVRQGDTRAYGALYERHLGAARRGAAALVSTTAEREDLVAEGFTRVLRVLRGGRGPDEEFRAYLLTTMRNIVISSKRRAPLVSLYAEVPDNPTGAVREDPMSTRVHANVAADAFASLPERWRMVLWHTEIEGESPAEIAPLLGMTPNGVAALAYRAREGLRQAYLQQHLPEMDRRECKAAAEQLAAWVRRGMPHRKNRRITAHLERCPDCRELVSGLRQVNSELRAVVAPLILGAPFALAYLSSAGTSGGAVLAAAGTTVSWLTAAKTVAVGAAIATAALTTVATDPLPGSGDLAVAAPDTRQAGQAAVPPPAPVQTPAAGTSTQQPDPSTGVPPQMQVADSTATPGPTTATVDPNVSDTATTKEEKKAARQAAKEARQEAKADQKAAKQEAKTEQKADKKNK